MKEVISAIYFWFTFRNQLLFLTLRYDRHSYRDRLNLTQCNFEISIDIGNRILSSKCIVSKTNLVKHTDYEPLISLVPDCSCGVEHWIYNYDEFTLHHMTKAKIMVKFVEDQNHHSNELVYKRISWSPLLNAHSR